MDTARYFAAVLVLVSYPPALCFWLLAHPLVRVWRRLGPGPSYTVILAAMIVLGAVMYNLREVFVSVDYGTNYYLWPLALLCYGSAVYIEIKCRKHLTFKMLVGFPEFALEMSGGRLLSEGAYARVRHPRYVSAMLGLLGVAFFANYRGIYILFLLSIPIIFLVAVLEERELRKRFGSEYVKYCDNVPRFFPRL
ncbi:MAG: isoprenylcysteine carboxylmethyltransferase family protein [Gemmatimonadota bacterium]|jgi:protein-S-isoprenylcysteine O-methyltransferase Ste14